MKMNGITLESRGRERVCLYGDWTHRTVYTVPNKWEFYVKVNGNFVRVYHGTDYFATNLVLNSQDVKQKICNKLSAGIMPYGFIIGQAEQLSKRELAKIAAELLYQIGECLPNGQREEIYLNTAKELIDDGFLEG